MKLIVFGFIFLSLTACQGLPQGDSDFYTWVDETGQIRTIKKESNKPKAVNKSPKNETKAPNVQSNNINPDDFIDSESIDKKLADEKMFAWQDATGAQVVREEVVQANAPQDTNVLPTATQEASLKAYRKGDQVLFEDIDGISIDLADYYQFNQKTELDYLLIELTSPVKIIQVKSFVGNRSVAMPQIIPLTDEFKQNYAFENPYQYREPESWHSYGYLHGELSIPNSSRYLLILPSPQSGVIEIEEGGIIKQSNLGSMVFTAR
jgi:hypothetical protein